MELIRNWLTQVICAAMIAAAADGLMPKGPVKKVGTLICAMMLLCAVLRPVVNWSATVPKISAGEILEQNQLCREQLKQDGGAVLKSLIEQQTAAYISDKAAGIGAACQAEVACAQRDGVWFPQSVRIIGELDEEQREKLTLSIQSELGVQAEYSVRAGGE